MFMFSMSHLHSPAPTNRGGVRQVQVLRGAAGRVALSVCCEGHIETEAMKQSPYNRRLLRADDHRLRNDMKRNEGIHV